VKSQPERRERGPEQAVRGAGAQAGHIVPPAQRWRLTFARERDPDRRPHREVVDEWIERVKASGLPLPPVSGRLRAPLTFAAPLPAGIECREELADLWLRQPLPTWRVREALLPTLPALVTLVRLDDVWVGRPALAAALRAADYTVVVPRDVPVDALERATERLLASRAIDRPRTRGTSTVHIDVRPLIESVAVDGDRMALQLRTRFLPDRGAGRPEDVLGILDESLGSAVAWGEPVRERLHLSD
jgi:Uncharacterized protein conserved in bacteria (DUF2344)